MVFPANHKNIMINTNTKTVRLTNEQFDKLIQQYIDANDIKIADGYSVEGSFGGQFPDSTKPPTHEFDLIDRKDNWVATVNQESFVDIVNSETGASFKDNMDIVAALPEI